MFLYAMYTSNLRQNSAGSSSGVPRNGLGNNTRSSAILARIAAEMVVVGRCPLFDMPVKQANYHRDTAPLPERQRYCLPRAVITMGPPLGSDQVELYPASVGSFMNTSSVSKFSSSGSGSFRAARSEADSDK